MNARPQQLAALLAAALVAAGSAHASPRGDGFAVQARVLSSTPVYDTINEPRRECWTETVGYEREVVRGSNAGGAIIGAIAGGLIGSTVGKGNGKVAAAAVGAATGAVVGDRLNERGDRYYESRPRQVERCQVHDNFRDVVTGYDVRYRFQDREYTTRLPYEPGKWLTLNVSFTVADDPRRGWKHSRDDWDD